MKSIALVSYNTAPSYLHMLKEKLPLALFENIFNPKQPSNVNKYDRVWQQLIAQKDDYDRIIIFAGKKSSGSLEIIRLAVNSLPKEKIFFVLCKHDFEEKVQLFTSLGFSTEHYGWFDDSHTQCREWPIMLDYAHSFLGK